MSDPSCENRARQLRGELTALEQREAKAKAARENAEVAIREIRLSSRLHDRHRWLVSLANGDPSVLAALRPLRDVVRTRKKEIGEIHRRRATIVDEMTELAAEDLARGDSSYGGLLADKRGLERGDAACGAALSAISTTRRHITKVSSSMRVNPTGKAALAAVDRNARDLSAQLKKVYDQVVAVNRIGRPYGRVNARCLDRLNTSFAGREASSELRKRELDAAIRTLDEVRRRIGRIRRKIRKRMKVLDRELARLVKANRDRLLRQ